MTEDIDDPIKYAVKNEKVDVLCKAFFDIDLYPTQEKIVRDIAYQKERRIILNCYTQYGKTLAIGVGVALHIILYNKEDIDIGLLGPAKSDARSIRDDMLEYGLNSNIFKGLIDTSKGSDPDDMLKSASKDKVTFSHQQCGNCDTWYYTHLDQCPKCDSTNIQTKTKIKIECMSASSGQSGKGGGLMGDGVDILVMDESNRIDLSVWQDSADRLLNKYDSMLVEAGNPKHQSNQFNEHWRSSEFKKYHVGEYSLDKYEDAFKPTNLHTASGLEEGRHIKDFFDEKAKNVSGRDSVKYAWKYKSIFPDQIEGGLISQAWVREAQDNNFNLQKPNIKYAIDVAGEGKDYIVLTRKLKEKDQHKVTDQWAMDTSNNTKKTAAWAADIVKQKETTDKVNNLKEDISREKSEQILQKVADSDVTEKVESFIVDYTGIGNGVWSELDSIGFNAFKFKAGTQPDAEKEDYVNKKARNFFKLRDVLQDGDLDLADNYQNNQLDMPENRLLYQLGHMKREPARRDKDKVVDPENKSPDFADSLMMAMYGKKKSELNRVKSPFASSSRRRSMR